MTRRNQQRHKRKAPRYGKLRYHHSERENNEKRIHYLKDPMLPATDLQTTKSNNLRLAFSQPQILAESGLLYRLRAIASVEMTYSPDNRSPDGGANGLGPPLRFRL